MRRPLWPRSVADYNPDVLTGHSTSPNARSVGATDDDHLPSQTRPLSRKLLGYRPVMLTRRIVFCRSTTFHWYDGIEPAKCDDASHDHQLFEAHVHRNTVVL